jgi:hypothetical protein
MDGHNNRLSTCYKLFLPIPLDNRINLQTHLVHAVDQRLEGDLKLKTFQALWVSVDGKDLTRNVQKGHCKYEAYFTISQP